MRKTDLYMMLKYNVSIIIMCFDTELLAIRAVIIACKFCKYKLYCTKHHVENEGIKVQIS